MARRSIPAVITFDEEGGGYPAHPIYTPPGFPAHPIADPPLGTWGGVAPPVIWGGPWFPPGMPAHPIYFPPGEPAHPIEIPPGWGLAPEHPIYIPTVPPGGHPAHPIYIPSTCDMVEHHESS